MHYQGASGRWSLDRTGASDAHTALFGFWTIRDGEIIAENFGAFGAGTIRGLDASEDAGID